MANKGGSTDYTRVCKRCGTARLLPKAYAKDKGPSARQVAGLQRATKFAMGKQREKYSMQSSALQSHQDRFIANATCPNCGSTDYDQYGPGDEIPAGIAEPVDLPPPLRNTPDVPAPSPSMPAPPATPPQWGADPYGRHELRFFDGQTWTAAVVDAGAPGVDVPV
jgi:Protein of unknown function (DUF2510)